MTDTFPRQYARTRRLTLGEPRDLTINADGTRVAFARSRGGDDPVNCLWVADLSTGDEHLVADPISLLGDADDADLSPEERALRERTREAADGVTSYATDRDGKVASFSLGGQLFVSGLVSHRSRAVPVEGPVFDPRPDPLAARIAYVSGRTLRIAELDGRSRALCAEPGNPPTVSWGSADFVAAEEMGRYRGYWWSPDGATIAACRVDDGPVGIWHIADPSDPGAEPRSIRYPAAGTENPSVTLHLCALDGSAAVEVTWDRARFPYLAKVNWNEHGLALVVQSRDQCDLEVLVVDTDTGSTTTLWRDHDDQWVELVPGTGSLIDDGVAVMTADRDGVRRLVIGDELVSPVDVQLRSVIDATDDPIRSVTSTGSPIDDPTVVHVYRWTTDDGFTQVSNGDGVHQAVTRGGVTVTRHSDLDNGPGSWVLPDGHRLTSHAEHALVEPNVALLRAGDRRLATAVLLPTDHDGSSLPVLLDPYGGPHAQRVLRSRNAFATSQWFADQGFAVVVVDGRGTPGRGSEFERAVHHDLADGVLDDQIDGLRAAAAEYPELDLDRVAIRGWSFGGYLSALAVLQRPDVFHAAIAGAPVTEWRLYDTHYTERYLGDPGAQADVYDANSLLPLAAQLTRPLLLVHGLADDNVVAAHTLQLSSALLAAGKAHEVLPLVGVTHMTPQEVVAENLLLHQLDFLRRALPAADERSGTVE